MLNLARQPGVVHHLSMSPQEGRALIAWPRSPERPAHCWVVGQLLTHYPLLTVQVKSVVLLPRGTRRGTDTR